MITRGTIVVHRNPASPFPMYFYAIEEHNGPQFGEFSVGPGFWYGLYVLPDFLALQTEVGWQQFPSVVTKCGRRFVVDVGLPMYVRLNNNNVVETFVATPHERRIIRAQMENLLFGGEDEWAPGERETAFVNHPEYLAAFKLTKRAQGLKAYV